jgi:phosphatidyl-myo-inositol dimannoside synthase
VYAFNRLLLLCPDLHETGGIGEVTRLLAGILEEEGWRGEIWSLAACDPAFGRNGTSWDHLFANGRRGQFAFWGARKASADAHQVFAISMHLHLTPVLFPLMQRGARVVTVLHGTDAWMQLGKLRSEALLRCHKLLAVSRFTADQFLKFNPQFSEKRIAVCPWGLPAPPPPPPADNTQAPFALIVGRMSSQERYKGHDELIEIWPEVIEQFPRAELRIAGGGDDCDRLMRKAAPLRISGHVKFLGHVNQSTLQSVYNRCSFFVMPSSGEGFGLVFLEAMRAAKACIGGHGAAEEIIEDGVTGRIIAPGNRNALLEAVIQFFGDPKHCRNFGEAGRRRFEACFTRDKFKERFLNVLWQ